MSVVNNEIQNTKVKLAGRTISLSAFLIVVAYALYSSSKWVMLAEDAGVETAVLFVSRFVGLATFAVMAVMFSRRLPNVKKLVTLVAVLILVNIVLVALSAPISGLANTVLVYASGICYGVASSLFFLLCMQVFCAFSLTTGAIMFGLAQLFTNCLMLLLALVPSTILVFLRLGFPVIAVVTLYFTLAGPLRRDGIVAWPVTKDQDEGSAVMTPAGLNADSGIFPATKYAWVVLLLAAFIFDSLFGVIAQVSSTAGDSFALYEPITDVVLIVIDALMLAFLCINGERFSLHAVLLVVTVLYATGFALYSYVWETGSPVAGALIRGGFDCSTVLLWVLLARKAHANQVRTYFYFGLFRCIASVYPGRLLGYFLLQGSGSQIDSITRISSAALWIICIFGIIIAFLASGSTGSSLSNNGSSAVGPVDLFAEQLEAFAARYQLSRREQEVLAGLLKGYTRESIAQQLYLSSDTVKSYVSRLYAKTKVNSKQDLIKLFEIEKSE